MEFNKQSVAQIIQDARKEENLTQAQFAETIGISEKHLSRIETGKNYPALDTFIKILDVLKLTLEDFDIVNPQKNEDDKLYLQSLINKLSKKQLNACKDILEAALKHI